MSPSLIHRSELELLFLSHFQVSLSLRPVKFSLGQHFERKGQEGNIGQLVLFLLASVSAKPAVPACAGCRV